MRYFYVVCAGEEGALGSFGIIEKFGFPSRKELLEIARKGCGQKSVITNIIEMTKEDFYDFFPEEIRKESKVKN